MSQPRLGTASKATPWFLSGPALVLFVALLLVPLLPATGWLAVVVTN